MPGIGVGCWTDRRGLTGVTVVLCPDGAVLAVDVRGGAPGTRETELARPGMLVERAQAVLLTGGSAYGLEATAGVMRWLEERGQGYAVPGGVVPIVPAATVFDLAVGRFDARPGPAAGYAACDRAGRVVPEGSVGAGTGCTVGKRYGLRQAMRGGQGTFAVHLSVGGGPGPAAPAPVVLTVGALVVVNAVGDVVDPASGAIVAGTRDRAGGFAGVAAWRHLPGTVPGYPSGWTVEGPAADPGPLAQNTTIGVVATDAPLTRDQAQRVAWMAHDGLARAIRPAHTTGDGDVLFVLACDPPAKGGRPAAGGALPGPLPPAVVSAIGDAAAEVVATAIVRAVRAARGLPGLPAAGWGATPSHD